MRLPAALLGTLIAFSACAGPQDEGIRHDLRNESATNGLALMTMGDPHPTVIPFDSEQRQLDFPPLQGVPYATSTSGHMVGWYRALSPAEILAAGHAPNPMQALQSELVIRTTEGTVVTRRRFVGNIGFMALNEEARRLVISVDPSAEYQRGGTYWESFDFSSRGFIDDAVARADWSPGGAALAYQTGSEIRIFDVATNHSRHLAEGTLQAWSPNGKWIAFQSVHRRPELVTPDGVPVDWPLGRLHLACCLIWSPDGRFVSFDESLEIPLLFAYQTTVVCRVTDGACTSIPKAPTGLRWIVNYRSLLSGPDGAQPPIPNRGDHTP